jgi:Rap1a immunity proteins
MQRDREADMRLARPALPAVLFACTSPSFANADFLDGNKLFNECAKQTDICYGYLYALADLADKSYGLVPRWAISCIPRNTVGRPIRDVVMNRLNERPPERTSAAVSIALPALAQAWPCPN